MAPTVASLPAGSHITDCISLGVMAKFFPLVKVREVLKQTNRASVRGRDRPARVVFHHVIVLAPYMRSSCREVLRCLLDPSTSVKVAGRWGISQTRSRLGAEPLRASYEAVGAHSLQRARGGSVEIQQDIAGVLPVGVGPDVDVTSLRVVVAQKADHDATRKKVMKNPQSMIGVQHGPRKSPGRSGTSYLAGNGEFLFALTCGGGQQISIAKPPRLVLES